MYILEININLSDGLHLYVFKQKYKIHKSVTKMEGGRGIWNLNYTGTQSCIAMLSYDQRLKNEIKNFVKNLHFLNALLYKLFPTV